MEVKDIAKKLGIETVPVIRKAEEFVRLCKIRCPQGLGAAESCKQVACLGLACKVIGEPFNKEAALKVTKSVDKLYQIALNSLQNILNVRLGLSAEQLSKQFGGSPKLAEAVLKTLSKYKTEFIAGLSPLEKGNANFTSNAYLTIKLDVDKTKLLNFAEVLEPEFNKIYASMNELCYGVTSKSSGTDVPLNSYLTEKRNREDMESEHDPASDLPQADPELVVPGLQKRQKTDDYESWKDKVLSGPKKDPPLNVWRQSSLLGFVKTYANRGKDELAEAVDALDDTTTSTDKTTPDTTSVPPTAPTAPKSSTDKKPAAKKPTKKTTSKATTTKKTTQPNK